MMFFFFKQKTAYEMRISDWSSDVCPSDLPEVGRVGFAVVGPAGEGFHPVMASAQAGEVVGVGLTWWAVGVVGLDVVEVGAGRGDGAVGEDAVLVAELDLFAHRVGWVVLVDGPVLIEVDHWRDPGVRSEPGQPVLDQAQELGSESAGGAPLRVGAR